MSRNFRYTAAPPADILRASQKDAQTTASLADQLTDLMRMIWGARVASRLTKESRVISDLFYLGLTTLLSRQTLGEEYCEITSLKQSSQLPGLCRRSLYIIGAVLLPYGLDRYLPRIRAYVRGLLDRGNSRSTGLRAYMTENLNNIVSPTPFYVASLAAFYLMGTYNELSKRWLRLRYVVPRPLPQSTERSGYELLGTLLVVQMAVQAIVHLKAGMLEKAPTAEPEAAATVQHDLADEMQLAWLNEPHQRKCTLCLESMKAPSATTCGHLFCWSCILEWVNEKSECPLCRQAVQAQHLLPLR